MHGTGVLDVLLSFPGAGVIVVWRRDMRRIAAIDVVAVSMRMAVAGAMVVLR